MTSAHNVSEIVDENRTTFWIRLKYEERLDTTVKYYTSKMVIVHIIAACGLSISELYYGLSYPNQCPIEPMISTFLIVHGATKFLWIFLNILAIINARFLYGIINKKSLARRLILINLLLQFLFAIWFFSWFIAGNIWIFRNKNHYQSSNSSDTNTFCRQELYDAAMLIINVTYGGFAVTLIATIIRRLISRKKQKNAMNNQ
ncbi:unnamed protein product [Adineta ricciae]|uniref:Uncharacterized protein n=1 Tax=Adineta ricciae TaxID=249248 RepID=A0A815VSR3_ADIRI|nr:unnamed protein product [Adineta ricciae]CAF1532028.1 unnamed protein product [Adineta ricciae]